MINKTKDEIEKILCDAAERLNKQLKFAGNFDWCKFYPEANALHGNGGYRLEYDPGSIGDPNDPDTNTPAGITILEEIGGYYLDD